MSTHELAAELLGRPDVLVVQRTHNPNLDARTSFIPYDFFGRTTKLRKCSNDVFEVWRESDGICETVKAQII